MSILGVTMSPIGLFSQERPKLTEARCKEIARVVELGDLDTIIRVNLDQCGQVGADIVAKVIKKSHNVQLESILIMGKIYSFAGSFRDKSIFEAAQSTARNRKASVLSRITSLYVLGIYYNVDGLLGQGLSELTVGPVTCSMLMSGSAHRRGETLSPLPANAVIETAATMDEVVRDASAPSQVRQVAKCIRFAMYQKIPSNLPVGALSLKHDCDGRYTVVNKFDEPTFGAKVTVTTPDTTITLPLEMGPRSTKELSMPRKSTVRIISNDKVIAEAKDTGKSCADSVSKRE